MAVLRKEKKGNFTVIDSEIFKDETLSLKAKGLLCTMLSLPNDWNYTIAGLVSLSSDGESAVRSTLKELEEMGYFRREQVRKNGKIVDTEYVISETKNCDFPLVENPLVENQVVENPRQLNTYISNTKESNTKSSSLRSEDIYKGLPENLIEALTAFEEMRKKIKSPLTDRAKTNLLSRLDRLAGNDIDLKIKMLDESILNNWKNVYLPKESDNGNRHDARRSDPKRTGVARTAVGSDYDYGADREKLPGVVYGIQKEE